VRPEKYNSNGKGIWLPTYQLVATIGQPGGPSWDNFDRCRRLCQLPAASIALAKSRTDATNGSDAAPYAQGPRSQMRRRRPATIHRARSPISKTFRFDDKQTIGGPDTALTRNKTSGPKARLS
jgi:hypothetical protein